MIKTIKQFSSLLLFLLCCYSALAEDKPNVLLIVADDMGFADLGAFGSEIETPNLDALAQQGIKLTNFHTAPACSPTRAMLLTGVDSHLVGLGNMAEELAPNQKGKPGYEGYLNTRAETIATRFKRAGYNTYMAGKWHLGKDEHNSPAQRGFDQSFAMLSGGASHYADMMPAYASNPKAKAPYRKNGKLLQRLPEDFQYSSQFYVDELLRNLNTGDKQKPFFAYLAFTAPHWPLQAPQNTIDKYARRYQQGYQVLHAQRFAKQQQLGLLPGHALAAPLPNHIKPWSELSEDEKKYSSKSMSVYAAMIDELDRHTGRLLQFLRNAGELDNTIVIFMADNGAEGHGLDATWPADMFPKVRRWIDDNHDFSLAAMGKPGSYSLYGEAWALAGAPGFRGYKGYPQEGGSRVPAFIYYPKVFKPGTSRQLVSVKDVPPTLLDLAGIEQQATKGFLPMSGRSKAKVLSSALDQQEVLAGELFGKQFVRQGSWKAVLAPAPVGNGQWQLFNIEQDLAEQQDLAAKRPNKLAYMKKLMADYRRQNGVILPDWVSGY